MHAWKYAWRFWIPLAMKHETHEPLVRTPSAHSFIIINQQVQLPNVPQSLCQLYVHPHFLSVHFARFLLWMVSELDSSSTYYQY